MNHEIGLSILAITRGNGGKPCLGFRQNGLFLKRLGRRTHRHQAKSGDK